MTCCWQSAPGRSSACEDNNPFPDLLRLSCDPVSLQQYPWHLAFDLHGAETGIVVLPRSSAWAAASHQPLQCCMQPCLAPPAATMFPLQSTQFAGVSGVFMFTVSTMPNDHAETLEFWQKLVT